MFFFRFIAKTKNFFLCMLFYKFIYKKYIHLFKSELNTTIILLKKKLK